MTEQLEQVNELCALYKLQYYGDRCRLCNGRNPLTICYVNDEQLTEHLETFDEIFGGEPTGLEEFAI